MNELGDGRFELEGIISHERWMNCNASLERTKAAGKSAGQVMIGVHVTFALPSSRAGSMSVALAWHGDGLNRGRAMAIAQQADLVF